MLEFINRYKIYIFQNLFLNYIFDDNLYCKEIENIIDEDRKNYFIKWQGLLNQEKILTDLNKE